jgi:hypothetical protein
MDDREKALIAILFDDSTTVSERDDAAMQLEDFTSDRAINALLTRGKNKNEDEIVLNSIGESLGEIWIKRNSFDRNEYQGLLGTTRYGVYFSVKSIKPEWIKEFELDKDNFKS